MSSDQLHAAIAEWARAAAQARAEIDEARAEIVALADKGVTVTTSDREWLIGWFPGLHQHPLARKGWQYAFVVCLVTAERHADRQPFGLSGAPAGWWEWQLVSAHRGTKHAAAIQDRGAERSRMLAVKSAVESWTERVGDPQFQPSQPGS